MSETQRYGCLPAQTPPIMHDDGAYVLHSDHLAMVEQLEKEIERLVSAIDEEKGSCQIGVFNRGDDPVKAIKELMLWSQGVGEYFIKAERDSLKEENERMKAQLAALQWQPITPENLPKVGDEVWNRNDLSAHIMTRDWSEATRKEFDAWGYTHFRPINAPTGGAAWPSW